MKNTVNGVLWLPQSPLQIRDFEKMSAAQFPRKKN